MSFKHNKKIATDEKKYEQVYGDTFAMYSVEEIKEFIEPFEIRFKRNGINPKKLFKDKNCFDAGCGNGRGALFMLMNGAKHVTCYDYSKKNIRNTKNYIQHFGFLNKITLKNGTLEKIPFTDNEFDFV